MSTRTLLSALLAASMIVSAPALTYAQSTSGQGGNSGSHSGNTATCTDADNMAGKTNPSDCKK